VAGRALGSDIREDQFGVALRTAQARVHAPQRIPGAVVIELGQGANRLPAS
jgi:hypothetical protein